jgi:membrane protease YdiL (CAAX protease family)
MKQWIARHDTAVFLILTYGISWPLWLVSGALSRTTVRAPDLHWLVAQIGVFAPAYAGMAVGACVEPGGVRRASRLLGFVYAPAVALGFWIATRGFASFTAVDTASTWGMNALAVWILVCFSAGRNRLVSWPGSPAPRAQTVLWSASCLIATAALFLVAWAMTGGPAGGASNVPAMPVRPLTPFGLVAAFAVNLAYGGSLGEEPGWRGAWLPRLLRRHPPVAASVIISFWWALWHAPIDLSQGFGLPGIGGLIVRQIWTLPVTIIFTWVTLRAGGSLLPPMILHTTINAIPFVLGRPVDSERALGGFFVLLLIVAFVAGIADPRLRGAPRKEQTARSL